MPEARPQTIHLQDLWSRPEAASAKDAVQATMETPGWQLLLDAIDARLRTEQRTMMRTQPAGDEKYDRAIGRWAGLSDIESIAKGIVAYGKEQEDAMRQED